MSTTFFGISLQHGEGEVTIATAPLIQIPNVEKKSLLTALDLLNAGLTEVPMLWKPFFPSNGVVGLTGSSDCGKSLFLRQMAIAVSQGSKTFLGFPLNVKHAKALYVCTEDDKEGIAALINKQALGTEKERLSNLFFLFDAQNLLLKVDEFLEKTKVDLVVIDVWSDTFDGNPNNWVDIRKNLTAIKVVAEKHGCLIAILHHTVKNAEKHAPDKSKLNGSQAIEAKLRCLLELRNGDADNERQLFVLKANYMSRQAKAEGLLLDLNTDSLQFSNSGKTVSKAGVLYEGSKKKYDSQFWITKMKELRKEPNLSYESAVKVLNDTFPDEKVPSKSWFIEQFKNLDSQNEA